ncbi:hypothetical protein CAL7716_034470 [Calothrix sp. PCC 7716]|nr:hypothetical protein CAL7716_034470 [Calothrix sp. PCC 7716]
MPRKLNRRPPSKEPAQKILIACEGSKTEPIYFESIRNELRLRTLQIIVLRQNKTDPRGIIERLIEERKQTKQNQEWSNKDSAWAVFDGDDSIIVASLIGICTHCSFMTLLSKYYYHRGAATCHRTLLLGHRGKF